MLMPLSNSNFAENEFGNLNLGDVRLNSRAIAVAMLINGSPQSSFPDAANGRKSELKGFYRFFQNDQTNDQNVLETHYRNTILRVAECNDDILLVSDSIFIVPAKYSMFENLKDLGKGKNNGLRIHYMIAVNARTHDILGITDLRIIDEDIKHTDISLEDESDIWFFVANQTFNKIDQYLSKEEADKLTKRCIFVGDRESDDFSLLFNYSISIQ